MTDKILWVKNTLFGQDFQISRTLICCSLVESSWVKLGTVAICPSLSSVKISATNFLAIESGLANLRSSWLNSSAKGGDTKDDTKETDRIKLITS